MPVADPCPTCGLPLPANSPSPYCTPYCSKARHRYPRARVTLQDMIAAARLSERLDRPEIAEREWHAVELWRARLQRMREHIVNARRAAGLPVDLARLENEEPGDEASA